MSCRVCSLSRFVLLAALLFIGAAPQSRSTASPESVTSARIEVRLRKLHLVRPDLIPYPIYFEVCC